MNKLHETVSTGIKNIQLAGEQAASSQGALDEATQALKDLDESEFAQLIAVDNRFTGRHEYSVEDAQHNATHLKLLCPTGYIGVVDTDYKGDIGYALLSMSGQLDPENAVQQTVNTFEDSFCIASMTIAKALRGLAYTQRPRGMRQLSPVQWAIEERGAPLTLGWRLNGHGIFVAGSGFMPGVNLQHALDDNQILREHLATEPDATRAFRGSGLADEAAIGSCIGLWAKIVDFGHEQLNQGASLN